MQLIKFINSVLAFLLELLMFASVFSWGYQQGKTSLMKYVIGGGLAIIAIVLWAVFAAPNSGTRLPFLPRLVFELTMFLAGAFLLYKTGYPSVSAWFAVLACISVLLAYTFKQ